MLRTAGVWREVEKVGDEGGCIELQYNVMMDLGLGAERDLS